MLMAINHKGKGPESYGNKETSGSHGGNRYREEHIPYHNSEGIHGGGSLQGQVGSRTTPRHTYPHSQMNPHNPTT
jgi:hypothetical protein